MKELKKIAEWISQKYPTAEKIVEVGVGNINVVLEELSRNMTNTELIGTDIRKVSTPQGVKFIQDDITNPEMEIYEGAELIYSMRPPAEFYPFLSNVSDSVNSDLLVNPVSSEESPHWGNPINYSGSFFYLKKRNKEK